MNVTHEVCEHCLQCTKQTACPGLTVIDTDYGKKKSGPRPSESSDSGSSSDSSSSSNSDSSSTSSSEKSSASTSSKSSD